MGIVPYGGPRYTTGADYPIAVHVSGQSVVQGDTTRANIIFVADVDFISDQFFEIRRRGMENLDLDNVSFFLNCIDVLAGDDSFVELRRRRVLHRTLTTVEARTRAYAEQRAVEEQQATADAQTALAEAQQRLDARVGEVQSRTDLDATTKQVMARNLQEAESRRFDAAKATIEAARDSRIDAQQGRDGIAGAKDPEQHQDAGGTVAADSGVRAGHPRLHAAAAARAGRDHGRASPARLANGEPR